MTRRTGAVLMTVVLAAAGLLGGSPPVAASPVDDPWGPPHVLFDGHTSGNLAQATTTDGTTVTVYVERPRWRDPGVAMVAVRPSGGTWSEPTRLSDERGRGAKVIAWGAGRLSVIWATGSGENKISYSMRSLTEDGTLGDTEKLIKVDHASPIFKAAINSHGQVALAWSDADRYDRVVVRQTDGTWTHLPRVPIFHSGTWGIEIPEPRALFLDDAGRVSTITWGTTGGSGTGIWLARPGDGRGWSTQRILPVNGWVNDEHASYTSNPRGDLAVVSGREETSGRVSVLMRFAAAGEPLGDPIQPTDYQCFRNRASFCAGAALADDGTATVAYPRAAGGDDIVIEVARRAPDGTWSPAQVVSGVFWQNIFDGVVMAGNAGGDAVVSYYEERGEPFAGVGFVRCPAAQEQCVAPTFLEDAFPARWRTSMGDDAEVSVTWSVDEWIRDEDIITRQLAAAG